MGKKNILANSTNSQESEPGVFGSLEWEPGVFGSLEPEPLGKKSEPGLSRLKKKVRSRSRSRKKICRLPSPASCSCVLKSDFFKKIYILIILLPGSRLGADFKNNQTTKQLITLFGPIGSEQSFVSTFLLVKMILFIVKRIVYNKPKL